ncbi:MAG: hypothetical protein ACX93N_13345 [Pseudohaliea sp.]
MALPSSVKLSLNEESEGEVPAMLRSIIRSLLAGSLLACASALVAAQDVYYSNNTSHSGEIATAASELAGSLGGSAVGFDGNSGAEWSTAAASASVILQGQSAQVASLSSAERSNLASFVSGGGTLLLLRSQENLDLMNEILGTSMTAGTSTSGSGTPAIPRTAAGDASSFSSAPATLPSLNDMQPINTASIPPSVLNAYELTGATHVASGGLGAGSVTYLSWDWCCGDTPAQRADWDAGLFAAAGFSPAEPEAVPVSRPLVTVSLCLALALLGAGYLRRRPA